MRQEYLESLVRSADIFVGIGTSAQVYPAAGLIPLFNGTKEKYFIDPKPTYDLLRGFEVLEGRASSQMPVLAEKLLNRSAGQ